MADRAVDPPGVPAGGVPQGEGPATGGPLLVAPAGGGSGNGVVVVATDALLTQAERLARLRDLLADSVHALGGVHVPGPDLLAAAPPAARQSVHEVASARAATRAASTAASDAAVALREAIERYALGEAQQRERMILLGGQLGTALGPLLRDLVLLGLPALLVAHAAGWPQPAQVAALREWMLDHPELITSPAFVEAVRATSMSLDETAGSALGLPPGVAGVVAAAAGFTGVQAGAAYLIAAGRPLGLFREGPIHVDRVSTAQTTSAPEGSLERLARVPEGDQVRIERYDAPGEPPRFVVYVGPTETFSPLATDEPWDLTSNVQGVAGLDAGSLRATRAAMIDAGIRGTDQVQLVGFSQGGLVATRVAASGEWNVVGLETYGAPAGGIELPDGLAGMAVRNTDDFVPALAGPQLDNHLLQIERQAFTPGSSIPTDLPAPAHQRSAYAATAAVIDQASSQAVREQVAAMDAFTADYRERDGSTVTSMLYLAGRGAEKGSGPAPHAVVSPGASIP
ncbi:MAG: hypothetical protein ABI566_02305 [Pseudolysinimonas sp.]